MERHLIILALLCGLLCASCATSGDGSPVNEASDLRTENDILPNGALAAQTLEVGECGLFGFSKSSRKLVFFATEERALHVSSDSRRIELTPDGEFPASRYGDITLELGRSEVLEGGARYNNARLSDILPDGFTRVQPLVVLLTCESPS